MSSPSAWSNNYVCGVLITRKKQHEICSRRHSHRVFAMPRMLAASASAYTKIARATKKRNQASARKSDATSLKALGDQKLLMSTALKMERWKAV
jgi:hypothetical protein